MSKFKVSGKKCKLYLSFGKTLEVLTSRKVADRLRMCQCMDRMPLEENCESCARAILNVFYGGTLKLFTLHKVGQ